MDIFISYSHKDKNTAGKIKHYLEHEFGVNVFLAHHDIQPTKIWIKEIIKGLKKANVLIALLTNNFENSNWTDQEVGFALCKEILIIPVKINIDPYGFQSQYQAYKLKTNNIYGSCIDIAKIIVEEPNLKVKLLDSLIKVFGKSDSFNRTENIIEVLWKFNDSYSKKQKNNIIQLAESNSQIYSCYKAKKKLKIFIRKYKKDLDENLLKKLEKKIEQV